MNKIDLKLRSLSCMLHWTPPPDVLSSVNSGVSLTLNTAFGEIWRCVWPFTLLRETNLYILYILGVMSGPLTPPSPPSLTAITRLFKYTVLPVPSPISLGIASVLHNHYLHFISAHFLFSLLYLFPLFIPSLCISLTSVSLCFFFHPLFLSFLCFCVLSSLCSLL